MKNDFRVMKVKHLILETYPRFQFRKNLHWSTKLEAGHRGYNNIYRPNHPKKGSINDVTYGGRKNEPE